MMSSKAAGVRCVCWSAPRDALLYDVSSHWILLELKVSLPSCLPLRWSKHYAARSACCASCFPVICIGSQPMYLQRQLHPHQVLQSLASGGLKACLELCKMTAINQAEAEGLFHQILSDAPACITVIPARCTTSHQQHICLSVKAYVMMCISKENRRTTLAQCPCCKHTGNIYSLRYVTGSHCLLLLPA